LASECAERCSGRAPKSTEDRSWPRVEEQSSAVLAEHWRALSASEATRIAREAEGWRGPRTEDLERWVADHPKDGAQRLTDAEEQWTSKNPERLLHFDGPTNARAAEPIDRSGCDRATEPSDRQTTEQSDDH